MIDVGYIHMKGFAENAAENLEFASTLSKTEIEYAFNGKISTQIQKAEDELCKAFGKFLADKDFVFGSFDFDSEADRVMSAEEYVDLYYRKALLKYFLRKRLEILEKRGAV